MPVQGYDLGVPLYNLYEAGVRSLPTLATIFASAYLDIKQTAYSDDVVFSASAMNIPSLPAVKDQWDELRSAMRSIFGETSENLSLTANALLYAVAAYTATDTAAGARFNQLLQERGCPKPVNVPDITN